MKLFRAKSTKLEPIKLCFGVPLETTLNSIPPIVEKCTRWILKHATKTEGVFRLSANQATVEELVSRFDKGENVDFESPLSLPTSAGKVTAMIEAHVVAALLKRWFRELPEPLCTLEMYDMWMAAASINDPQTKILQVKKVLSFLPQSNQILIKYLASFLREFSKHSDITKMTSTNLSICFAPNLLRPPDSIGLADQIEESPIATGLLVMFIEYFDLFFASVQGDGAILEFNADTGSNGKSAPKIGLTDNLLPPPPITAQKPEAAPMVALKKPTPKYSPAKRPVSTKSPLAPITGFAPNSSASSSSEPAIIPSPPTSPLPPPLPEDTLSADIPLANHSLPPPPITAPKPKLRSSYDGKEKLRKSAKKSTKMDSTSAEADDFSDFSAASSPSSPNFSSPLSASSGNLQSTSFASSSPGAGAAAPKKAPPARPVSAAPSFK
jgi:hypothetical protein